MAPGWICAPTTSVAFGTSGPFQPPSDVESGAGAGGDEDLTGGCGGADLSAELAAALERHIAATSAKSGRVFLQDSGRPARAEHLYAWRDVAASRAGIPKKKGVKLHVMRQSACSALAAMGAPMIAIQSLAGHQSPQTTAIYMHLAGGVQAAAVRLFDEARGKGRGTP